MTIPLLAYFMANAEPLSPDYGTEWAATVSGVPTPSNGEDTAWGDFWLRADAAYKLKQGKAMLEAYDDYVQSIDVDDIPF